MHIPVDGCLCPGGRCSILISTLCVALFYHLLIILASDLLFSQGENYNIAYQMLMVSWHCNYFGPWNKKSWGLSPLTVWYFKQYV